MLLIGPHKQLLSNTMDVFESWEDQEIQFDLSIKYIFLKIYNYRKSQCILST